MTLPMTLETRDRLPLPRRALPVLVVFVGRSSADCGTSTPSVRSGSGRTCTGSSTRSGPGDSWSTDDPADDAGDPGPASAAPARAPGAGGARRPDAGEGRSTADPAGAADPPG